MKTTTLLGLILLILTARVSGAAPESVTGCVLYGSGSTLARTQPHFAVLLKTDGSFQGIFKSTNLTPRSGPNPQILQNCEDGTWTYKKTDANTAELRLTGEGFPPSGNFTIVFTSDSEGRAADAGVPPGNLFVDFRIVPVGTRAPLANCSNRSFVRANGSALTGFVIANNGGTVLVRAIGPGLTQFGVPGALRHPALTVVKAADNTLMGANDGWSSATGSSANDQAISRTNSLVGAFPLTTGSKDSATVLSLAPGAYIAQVSSPEPDDSGETLIEVYMLP